MAVIICPECEGKVSSTLSACPHCGFKFTSKTVENDLNTNKMEINQKPTLTKSDSCPLVTVLKRKTTVPTTISVLFIFFGVFFPIIGIVLRALGIVIIVWAAAFGIAFFVGGFVFQSQINKNNQQPKEIVYYNKSNQTFLLYDYNGNRYELTKETILQRVSIKQGAKEYTGVLYDNSKQLGWIASEDSRKLRDFVESLDYNV